MSEQALPPDLAIDLRQLVMTIANSIDLVGVDDLLHGLHAIDDLASWVYYHHETPDGQGWPFHVGGAALPLEARIINVADTFQALAQERPYRKPLTPDAIMAILCQRVDKGRADPDVVAVIAGDLANCHRIALCCQV